VIDAGAGVEVGGRYRLPDGRVSLIAGATFDAGHTRRLLCPDLGQATADIPDGTGDPFLARRLATIAPAVLWPAADDLRRRTEAFTALVTDLPVRDVGVIASLDELAGLHEEGERIRRSHRPVQVAGALLAAACAGAGAALFALPGLAGGDTFTPTALLTLAVVAALVATADRMVASRHTRRERRILAAAGIDGPADLAARLGPLVDTARRRAVLEAAEAHREASAHWYALTAGAPLEWTVRNRDRISLLAAANHTAGYGTGPTARRPDPDAVLGAVVERIDELRHAGPTAGSLPLLLVEPGDGLDPAGRRRVLNGLLRLAAAHQIVLVTGDPVAEAWASEPAVAAAVGLSRLAPAPAPLIDVTDGQPVAPPAAAIAERSGGITPALQVGRPAPVPVG